MKKIAIAGASGYLGKYTVKELLNRNIPTLAIVRNPKKLQDLSGAASLQVIQAEVTKPESLSGILKGIDVLISTVGITRQQDGLSYMDVDFQANLNLLQEAQRAGVKKFIYVSAIGGSKYRNLKIFEAKEGFVDELKRSGIEYSILRPNGFFSDMEDFLKMAKKGKIFLFGDGYQKLNPIHGADLAEVVVDAIDSPKKEIVVGGPELLSQNEIAAIALKLHQKPVKITHLPNWLRRATIGFMRTFTSPKVYGPIEFFLTLMAENQIAPQYGRHRLQDFFKERMSH
ncbi:MAG: SDR family oxidoreductase [Bacteroidota bacterium]